MKLRRSVLVEDTAHIKAIKKAYNIFRLNVKTYEKATSDTYA